MWSFNDTLTPADQEQLVSDIAGMRGRVPMVRSASAGKNISPERAGDFTHGALILLDTRSDLVAYADDPIHLPIKKRLAAAAARLIVIDYEA